MNCTHAEAENEDDEKYGDGVEDDMDFEPLITSAEIPASEQRNW